MGLGKRGQRLGRCNACRARRGGISSPRRSRHCDVKAGDAKAGDLKPGDAKPSLPKTRGVPSRSSKSPKQSPCARELLARNLLLLRADRGWSQEHLAFVAGFHRTFVTHVELQSRNISLDNLEKLAKAFGVPVHELLMEQASGSPSKSA